MFDKKIWITSLVVLTVMFIGVTGCTDSDNTSDTTFAASGERGSTSASATDGFVYDEDFSLSGKVTKVTKSKSIRDPYTEEWVRDAYIYETTSERLVVDFPHDDGEKFYQVYVTTHDPESIVRLYPGRNYTYQYKVDKFSDYLVGFYSYEPRKGLGVPIIFADKVKDINETFWITPMETSLFHRFVSSDIVSVEGTDPELIDRNLYLAIEITPEYISSSKNLFEEGEAVRASGHILVREIDVKYNDVKHLDPQHMS